MPKFAGTIGLGVRDSRPDWSPFVEPSAPLGSPNVLVVVYDDVGMAALQPFGGRIAMPTMDSLARGGLRYSQWHTTPLCSPTRAALLNGRNAHSSGFGEIAEMSTGFPGNSGYMPNENGFLARILRDAGWATYFVGKYHNVPQRDLAPGSTRRSWPLQRGFDRFYGFLGGETNQWYPNVVQDNDYVDQPYLPESGYHLSRDLADQAIGMLAAGRAGSPRRPWLMYFAPGAGHAPHHVSRSWIERYEGVFADGYEVYRHETLAEMKAQGIMPPSTRLTALNPLPEELSLPIDHVRPWAGLDDRERALFTRMAEVYAGFMEYTDVQLGRIVEYLDAVGELENTIIIACSDNGASGGGTPNGSINENRWFNGYPDDIDDAMRNIDNLGGPGTYNHFPTGWAAAFSTPFKMFKRYVYFGGVATPLIIHWPNQINQGGELRDQYHHCTDIVPTILDCCGVEAPHEIDGVRQEPFHGISMRYTFADPLVATRKDRQYDSVLGARAVWSRGWRAVSLHAPGSGTSNFESDSWELYHTEVDRSESDDLAARQPDKLNELIDQWHSDARLYGALPLDDRPATELLSVRRPGPTEGMTDFFYSPGVRVPEAVGPNFVRRSYSIEARFGRERSPGDGMLLSQGSRFGGHALFLLDYKLHYVYNFLGFEPVQHLVSSPLDGPIELAELAFVARERGERSETLGSAELRVNGELVDRQEMITQPGRFSLSGSPLCVGFSPPDPVVDLYPIPFRAGHELISVSVRLSEELILSESEAERQMDGVLSGD